MREEPAAPDPQDRGDSPKDTSETGIRDRRGTGTRERNRKHALLACDQLEDKEEEQLPPERQCVLNTCSNQGGEGGGPPTHQCALPVSIQGMEGDTPTRQQAPLVRIKGTEERGALPEEQRALPAHGIKEREGGGTLGQEE